MNESLPGVPQLLSLGDVAKVINLPERRVRHWADKGALAFYQDGLNSWRWVRTTDLIDFASERGLTLEWEEVL